MVRLGVDRRPALRSTPPAPRLSRDHLRRPGRGAPFSAPGVESLTLPRLGAADAARLAAAAEDQEVRELVRQHRGPAHPLGFSTDTRDLVLDVEVEPDRSHHRKDEDELVLAVEQGRSNADEAESNHLGGYAGRGRHPVGVT